MNNVQFTVYSLFTIVTKYDHGSLCQQRINGILKFIDFDSVFFLFTFISVFYILLIMDNLMPVNSQTVALWIQDSRLLTFLHREKPINIEQ